ncbi:MAG: InlB B-repeat-containing protein, partial [Clostridia bacterium]|nr:InlB B-repeat-containing protein [Clostridia bacterium]
MAQQQYQLTYVIDGVVYRTEAVDKGARLTNLPKPEKEHHQFDGWGEVPARMPARDLTLEGHFSPRIVKVLFAAGIEQYGMHEGAAGTPVTPPRDPEKEGHRFVGWEGFEGVLPDESCTFEARFAPNEYRVTYEVDGSFRFVFRAPYGTPFPTLDEPRKKNHIFSGWGTLPETVPAEDTVVRGSFREQLYCLTRKVDGEVFSQELLPVGAPIDKKAKPHREGYYFSGWRKLPDTMPARDVTVAASMYPARYRVDFTVNGEKYKTLYFPYGEPIVPPSPPEEKGTLFGGWEEHPATMPARDLVINGVLNAKLYSLSFVADGEVLERVDLPEGAAVVKDVEPPQKEGFVFCGWDANPTAMPAHDLTLHAVYATVRAHYRFLIDGELYTEVDPEGDDRLVMPVPPPRDGKPFSGWNSMTVDPHTGATTFMGSYEQTLTHTLTFLLRGEVYEKRQLAAGEEIIPPTPEGEDFDFIEWRGCPAHMPARDVTVEASIRALRYRLSFAIDGEVTYTMTMNEGDDISCPAVAAREGCTFSGWQDVPKTMPSRDLTVHGRYIRNLHTLTYVIDGEILFTGRVACGEALTPPQPEEREGVRFIGWFPEISVMPDADTVIEGAYSDTWCLVEAYVDGVLHSRFRAAVGEPIPLPEIEVREGERFEWQSVPSRAPHGSLEIHGGRVQNTYTVTYMMGEIPLGTEEYRWGERIHSRIEAPECGQGAFLGWQGIEETMPAHDLVVQAWYESRHFKVTFLLENELLWEGAVPVGARIPLPEVPEREGFEFEGWQNFTEYMPPYSFTAHGSYTRKKYTVTFLYGAEVLEEKEYAYGTRILPPQPPVTEGGAFVGWQGLPKTMPARDITVSAHYEGATYRLSYVVEGELLGQTEVELGSKITPMEAPVREGYVFSGWKDLPTYMPDHEVIVLGEYRHRVYTVTYQVEDIIWRIDEYSEGDTVVPPEAPPVPHGTFRAWRNFTDTMPDYDFVCVAEYSEIFGHYTFVLEGETLAEGKCRMGEPIEPPLAPHRPGYCFTGWEGFAGVMPKGDATFEGHYVEDTFKVRYLLDGALYHEDGYREGDKIARADAPVREGFAFSGWKGLPKTMPADDVTVTGSMTPLLWRITWMLDGDVLEEKTVPCGSALTPPAVPEMHGRVFDGWEEYPEVMPAENLTVEGFTLEAEPRFTVVSGPLGPRGGTTVHKSHPKVPPAIAFVGEGRVRLLIDNICYTVRGSGNCVTGATVTDAEALGKALRAAYRKYGLPKRRLLVLLCDGRETDVMLDT